MEKTKKENKSKSSGKFSYWVKYAGIVDGVMGILTRKEYADSLITPNSHSRKLTMFCVNKFEDNMKIISQNKNYNLAHQSKQKLSLGHNTRNVKQTFRTTVSPLKMGFICPKFPEIEAKTTSKSPIIYKLPNYKTATKKSNRSPFVLNNRNQTVYKNTSKYFSGHIKNARNSHFLSNNSSKNQIQKINESEQITGIPNPCRYNAYIVNNRIHSKKFCSIHRNKSPIRENKTVSDIDQEVITIYKKPKCHKLKLISELIFNNAKIKTDLKSTMFLPLKNNPLSLYKMKQWDLVRKKIVEKDSYKSCLTSNNTKSHIEHFVQIKVPIVKFSQNKKELPSGNIEDYKNNSSNEESNEEIHCKDLRLSDYD